MGTNTYFLAEMVDWIQIEIAIENLLLKIYWLMLFHYFFVMNFKILFYDINN